MLTRKESFYLLNKYGRGSNWAKHCIAVAEKAVKLGSVLKKFRSINSSLLWSTSLLHDIGRSTTHDPILHGVEGFKILSLLGHEEEAFVCASHILFGLKASEAIQFNLPNRDFIPQTYEEKLVPLVDYLIEFDQPTTLNKRFSAIRKSYKKDIFFLERLDRAQETARNFMLQIENEIGESIEKILSDS